MFPSHDRGGGGGQTSGSGTRSAGGGGGGFSTSISTLGTASAALLFDCTDVSQQKVQFEFGAGQGFEYIRGDSSYNETYATFIRLGNT